jgi:hypothetical protein
MKKRYFPILTLIVVLMSANLACLASVGAPPAPTPTRSVLISTQAVQEFVQSVEKPTVDATAGTFTILLTEEQITSYVAYQLEQDPNPVIRNPQIFLENEQITIQGQITTDVMTGDGTLTAKINLDENGNPKIELLTAQFGSLQIPTVLLGSVSSLIDHYLNDYISQSSANYKIQSLNMASHVMTIVLIKK